MANGSFKSSDRENAYKLDRGFRSAMAGAAIGLVLGALSSMLFSRWVPENFFWPIVIVAATIFAVVFGLFFPLELENRKLDDDPGGISPAERVKRLQSDTKLQD